jgi:hypothetical protein
MCKARAKFMSLRFPAIKWLAFSALDAVIASPASPRAGRPALEIASARV